MKQKIFVERTEEERNEKSKNGGFIFLALVLSLFGLAYAVEFLGDKLSLEKVTDIQSSFIKLGVAVVVLIFMFVIYMIGYVLEDMCNRYKEIEPKNEPKETKSTRRRK
jgi:hypothetical protein